MPEVDLYKIFISRLNQAGISYMVTGSVAVIVYGQPRMTHDIDLVVQFSKAQLSQFISQFPPEQFYCPPVEIIRLEISRENRGHFNVIHQETGFKADFYPVGCERLHKWGMTNRKKEIISGDTVWLAPPEYVIIRKLQYYQEGKSSKHLSDIQSMREISSDDIEHEVLQRFIQEYNLQNEWNQVLEGR